MKITIRRWLQLSCLLLLLSLAALARAQGYPNRPVILVSPFPPGGGNDLISRTIAAPMSKNMGQNVVVENRPGAETVVGMTSVARAAPDGYTLILTSSTLAINVTLNPKLPYTPRDFEAISLVGNTPYIITLNTSSPIRSMADYVAQAKAKPGEVFAGSASLASRLGIELLNFQLGVKITHVPYKGAGAAVTDLMAGRLSSMFATPPSVLTFLKSGKLKGIGVTGPARSPTVPDQPTVSEALKLPGYEASTWYGIVGPARMPQDIVHRLSAEVVKALDDPPTRERLVSQAIDVAGSTPEQFKAYIESETDKWAKVIKFAGVTPEE